MTRRGFRGTSWGRQTHSVEMTKGDGDAVDLLLGDLINDPFPVRDRSFTGMMNNQIRGRAARWLVYRQLEEPGRSTCNFDPLS